MSKALFEEIRLVEAEAERILSDAENQSAEIVRDANKEAIKILSERDVELKGLRSNTINAATMQAAKEMEKELEQHRKNLDEIRKIASRKQEKAISLVLERLSELIGG